MSDLYSASGTQDVTTPTPGDTSLTIDAIATRRAKLFFWVVGHGGTPADNVIQWLVRRYTAVGTGTAVTPSPLDASAPAAVLAARQDHTAEPTYAAILFDIIVHQRGTYQWNAAPNKEIIVPAVVGQGIGWTAIHAAYAGSAVVTAQWQE